MTKIHWIPAFTLACVSLSHATRAQALDDWVAPKGTSVLNTSFQTLRTVQNRTRTFVDGVFVLRNVTIPANARVEVQGPRPMILVVAGNCTIDGELSGDGAPGQAVNTIRSANFPVAGGIGGPAGGAGGGASSSTVSSTPSGSPGAGPFGFAGFGGRGGTIAFGSGPAVFAAGGGGGTFGTVGDPAFSLPLQARGAGGKGSGASLGGAAGSRIFVDRVVDNDFWGLGYDVFQKRIVVGELPIPIGGSGGGGGGDESNPLTSWVHDARGGGGGGGGGCILIYAFGRITVGGQVHCNGGAGGGGELAGSSSDGGGGGGGSGGMLVLASRTEIVLQVRGETFARGDSEFCLAADGALSRQSAFGTGRSITTKYGALIGLRKNSGGFGGLGLLQLMAPVGTNRDGTNTILDDRITLMRGTQTLTGAEKQRYLAWRGWANPRGERIDDAGKKVPATTGGDMRPSPVLLPIF